MPDCYIALGGNQGDVRKTFERALDRLNRHPEISVVRTSQWFATAPVGNQTEATFLNGAAQLSVNLSPQGLLTELQTVEAEQGRVREVRWGARTLDLDLLLFDQLIMQENGLAIPHPACWYRRFVLDPLVEIAPDVIHPVKLLTIQALQQRLLQRPFVFAIAGLPPEQTRDLIEQFQPQYPEVVFFCWKTATAPPEPTLIAWLGADNSKTRFEDLPLVPRLDASECLSDTERMLHLLQSALDFG